MIAILAACACRQTSYWGDEITLFEHSLASTDDNYKAQYVLATALKNSGRLDDAIEHYRLAAGFHTEPDVLNSLAVALIEAGRPDEALVLLRQALELAPKHAYTHANLGVALAQTGRLDEAEEHFLLAIQLDPQFAPPHVGLASVYLTQKNAAGAIEHFRQALKLDPNQPKVQRALDNLVRSLTPAVP